ncbi:MAG: hypothetical protein JJD96_06080 [Thermoleophilia bacterium]|nr:hypothetical protein [Thermoleophilia bacterium]
MDIDRINFIVTPLVAAIVGFAVWYFQSRIEALRRAQEHLHDDRRKVYSEILEPFIRIFAGINNEGESKKAMQHLLSVEYKRTAFEFTLIGADEVVGSFNNLMKYLYSVEDAETPDPKEIMRLWGKFLLQIRINVGNPKTKLKPVDMLRSQIKDIDKIL